MHQLIEVAADVNMPTKDLWSPVHAASDRGHHGVVGRLLKAGAKVNVSNSPNNETPLYLAAKGTWDFTLSVHVINVMHGEGGGGVLLECGKDLFFYLPKGCSIN